MQERRGTEKEMPSARIELASTASEAGTLSVELRGRKGMRLRDDYLTRDCMKFPISDKAAGNAVRSRPPP